MLGHGQIQQLGSSQMGKRKHYAGERVDGETRSPVATREGKAVGQVQDSRCKSSQHEPRRQGLLERHAPRDLHGFHIRGREVHLGCLDEGQDDAAPNDDTGNIEDLSSRP